MAILTPPSASSFIARLALPAALGAMLALPPQAHAEIYTWKDSSGRVHFSDKPPLSGEVKTIGAPRRAAPPRVVSEEEDSAEDTPADAPAAADGADAAQPAQDATPAAADAPAQPQTLAEKEEAFRERRAAEAEARRKEEEERQRNAAREEECARARGQLTALESGQRVTRFDEKGERIFLDDAARSSETQRLRTLIDERCSQ